MKPLFFLSILSLIFCSCKSQQYTIDTLPDTQLIFGSGGGITGEVTTYTLLENGQVFSHNSLTEASIELRKLTKKEATACFEKIEGLQLSQMNFDHPGNMYYFLEEVKGEERNRVTWGSNDHKISAECLEFYKELRTTIK